MIVKTDIVVLEGLLSLREVEPDKIAIRGKEEEFAGVWACCFRQSGMGSLWKVVGLDNFFLIFLSGFGFGFGLVEIVLIFSVPAAFISK